MSFRVINAFVLLIILSVSVAGAGERMAVGVKAGTLGLGAEFDFKLTDHFAARLAINSYDYGNTVNDSGINFDSTLELGSVGAMIDYYPFSNGFHLTAGMFKNDNRLAALGIPEAGMTFDIGDNTYTTAEIGELSASMEFKDTVPYFGLGWGNPFNGGRFGVIFDLGLYKQGNPNIAMSTTSSVAGLDDDIALEVAELEAELEEFDFWPVLQVGVSWRF